MNIKLNGKPYTHAGKPTLSELIHSLALADRKLAVEINLEIIPRSQYSEHKLCEGDHIEIVHAIGGG